MSSRQVDRRGDQFAVSRRYYKSYLGKTTVPHLLNLILPDEDQGRPLTIPEIRSQIRALTGKEPSYAAVMQALVRRPETFQVHQVARCPRRTLGFTLKRNKARDPLEVTPREMRESPS